MELRQVRVAYSISISNDYIARELAKFNSWMGSDCTIAELKVSLIEEFLRESYCDCNTIKGFLNWLFREGHTPFDYSLHIEDTKPIKPYTYPKNKLKNLPKKNAITLVTQSQYDILTNELQKLKDEQLKIINDIATARADGDLSENAGYHAARERKSFIDGKILPLEKKIKQSKIGQEAARE